MSENREKQTVKRKLPRSAWGPGQSGNPGGRPKVAAEVRDLAREHGSRAIDRLVALMKSQNQSVALRAAEAILDRGFGRPMQAIEPPPSKPPEEPRRPDLSKLTDEELRAVVHARKIMQRLISEAT